MQEADTLRQFLMNRIRRSVIASIGLLTYSVGVYFQMQSDLGIAPWHALKQGLSMNFPISYGTASIIVSLVIIVIDLMLKERIGIGTFLDAFLVGIGTDVCLSLNFVPVQTSLVPQLGALFVGTVICCIGQWFYMTAALSCGPIDSFLVGVGKRFPKVPIGTVNLGILVVVLAACLLLGSPIGLGTVLTVFGTGFVMDAVFHVAKFNPRGVVHEGLTDTMAALGKALHKEKKISFQ